MSKGTTVRTMRIAAQIWDPAVARAEREDKSIAEVVREYLAEYGAGHTKSPR